MSHDRKTTLSALAFILGFGALGLGASAAPALAQPAPGPARAVPMAPGGERVLRGADANRDGRVTEAEAWDALSARFAAADANKDGGVSWEELRAYAFTEMSGRRAMEPARQQRLEERAGAMFRAIDADRDGRVTTTELRPFAEAMFRARDLNGDAAISRDEMRPHRARPARTQ